jgi:GntP family gluconate:H+ symporter
VLNAAGPILAIAGAEGAFGYMLRTTPIGDYLGELIVGWGIGLMPPFLLAATMAYKIYATAILLVGVATMAVVPILHAIVT